ncbi:MAG: acyl-CoA dehydrogenase family protein [Methylococcales bacterium]
MPTNNRFRELTHPCIPNDPTSSYNRFLQCANAEILKHGLTKEDGGLGDDFTSLCQAHESLGKISHDPGLILSINAHIWGALFPVLRYGSKDQKAELLPGLLSGSTLSGHAITEPEAGSDIQALKTTAIANNQNFDINGRKRFITNTPIADCLIVYAQLDNHLSAFIVHSNDPGVTFTGSPTVDGCCTATMGDVILNNCSIPKSRLLGRSGAGSMMLQSALELERAFVFAGIAGVMHWQLETVIKFSRERTVGNIPLGRNQAISHRIAEMKMRLDTARLWVYECAGLKDANKRITLASAETKLFASEAFLKSSLDAAHIMGATGLMEETGMSRLVQDAMAGRLFSGSSEIQKNMIAALLGTGEGFKVLGQ